MDEALGLKLGQLKEVTDYALRYAKRRRRGTLKDEAVNWADLHCISAEYRIDDSGFEYYAVCVEEASPEASRLANYIRYMLKKKGFGDVQVETEW